MSNPGTDIPIQTKLVLDNDIEIMMYVTQAYFQELYTSVRRGTAVQIKIGDDVINGEVRLMHASFGREWIDARAD
jgi:hypothetical protein